MAKTTAALRSMAESLRPKLADTRKFRLKKNLSFVADDAKKIAVAFAQVKRLSENPKLTVEAFLVQMVTATVGDLKDEIVGPDAEADLAAVMQFIPGSGAQASIVA